MTLADVLKEELMPRWRPERVVVTCEECGDVLYDTDEAHPHGPVPARSGGAHITAQFIESHVWRHEKETDHIGLHEPYEDVEVTVHEEGS